MNIQRIRRLRQDEPVDSCDFCDEPTEQGFQFMGDVTGPRGRHLTVCDECLKKTKANKIGFLYTGSK